METIKLLERDINGKKNKVLLKEGFIPAVIYNSKKESRNVMLDSSIAKKLVREVKSTTILDIELDDKIFKAIVKEIDFNPVTDELRHISFFEIDETKDMIFTIPFELIGIAPAVKNNLGVLVQVLNDIEVRCKVNEIIPSFIVDISKLEHPGQSISVDELNIPEVMGIINEDLKTATIVTITDLQSEEAISPITPTEGESAEGGVQTEGENTKDQASTE